MSGPRNRFFREPPQPPPYVLEDLTATHPRRLFSLFGIEWMAYPTAWIAPIWMAAAGILISIVIESGKTVGEQLLTGLAFGLLIAASIIAHYLGGAIAAKLVNAPMRFIFFTATLAYCRNDESREYPSRVHLLRTLGQPATHLLVGGTALGFYLGGQPGTFLLFLAILNFVFFVISMTPLPTMHGGVVLKHLRAWKRG
jgi:Zn-dependent protease